MPTAILVDGGFFIKRYRQIYANTVDRSPQKVAKNLHEICLKHLSSNQRKARDLYRIFYYDCPPLSKKAHHPVSQRAIDFSKTEEAVFRTALHSELRKLRKVALRLGRLSDSSNWQIKPEKLKELIKKEIAVDDLQENDLLYEVKQKGVDMKIGLDIASLSYKRLVKQIVLIAGDSDFTPAAKLARREGIDFILDPMWNPINQDLHEHIDGLMSTCPQPKRTEKLTIEHNKINFVTSFFVDELK